MKEITRFKLYFYPLLILLAGLGLTSYISYLLETDLQNRRCAGFHYHGGPATAFRPEPAVSVWPRTSPPPGRIFR